MKRSPGRPPLDDHDPSAQICLTVPGKQFDALEREAKLARVSVQDIIRRELKGKKYTK
jgi:hypothetical protein